MGSNALPNCRKIYDRNGAKMKFIYIILHYKNIEDTISCIKSIQNKCSGDIVVVNNSQDKKLEANINKQCGLKRITILHTEKNMGFARGLNIGINYAKNKHYDIYILLNNDTELLTEQFERKIQDIYKKTDFSVLGPDIINLEGEHSNPRREKKYTLQSVRKMVIKTKLEYYIYKFTNIDIINIAKKQTEIHYEIPRYNVEIQGSAIILSKNYITNEKQLYDRTFLYCEESILKYICDRDKLITYYDPSIKVLHKEGSSTKTIAKNKRSRRLFELKHSLYSRKVFYELIKDDTK